MFDFWKKNHDEVVVRDLDTETLKKFEKINDQYSTLKICEKAAMEYYMEKLYSIEKEQRKVWHEVYEKYQLSGKDKLKVDTDAKEIIRVADK